MADITRKQIEDIRKLTRAANRRFERASEGQRSALEYYIGKKSGAKKFSAATKGLTYEQAQAKIEKLQKFMAGKSTTKKGWAALKAANVAKANKAWKKMGRELTDQELAEILMQVDTKSNEDYYRAVNLVQAEKDVAELTGDIWKGTEKEISEAIAQKIEAEDALKYATALRKQVEESRAEVEKKLKEVEKRRAQVALRVDLQKGKRRKK